MFHINYVNEGRPGAVRNDHKTRRRREKGLVRWPQIDICAPLLILLQELALNTHTHTHAQQGELNYTYINGQDRVCPQQQLLCLHADKWVLACACWEIKLLWWICKWAHAEDFSINNTFIIKWYQGGGWATTSTEKKSRLLSARLLKASDANDDWIWCELTLADV